MNGMTETVASVMISTRPAWLLPWVIGFAVFGAAAFAALMAALVAGAVSAIRKGGVR